MKNQTSSGIVFDIQGFSVHDGPGCRTLVFLKGCPLSCRWCSNPERQRSFPEPLFRASKCIGDNLCMEACMKDAITPDEHGLKIQRSLCASCRDFACTDACCTGALEIGGYEIQVEALYRIIQRDRQYWGNEGGITLTGGEPFLQFSFASRILKQCHDAYIHTAAETCGAIPYSNFAEALPYLDWLFFDIKHMDSDEHRRATGQGNELILENAIRLSREFPGRMIMRMVVVPGFNDSPEHITQLCRFMQQHHLKEINLLPLHHLGSNKYAQTGQIYYDQNHQAPDRATLERILIQIENEGLIGYLSHETPF